MTANSSFTDAYMKNFGPFINKFHLGGTFQPDDRSMEALKMQTIEKSRKVRDQMFTQEKTKTLQERLKSLSKEDREKLESVQDPDMVTWFNRTKVDPRDKDLRTIPGCFYKVRAQGSATARDCDEINKFYKRSMVTCGVIFAHSYVAVQFLYESRIVSRKTVPLGIFERLPYALYVAPMGYLFYYMVTEFSRITRRLDAKYTPIWVRITEEQSNK